MINKEHLIIVATLGLIIAPPAIDHIERRRGKRKRKQRLKKIYELFGTLAIGLLTNLLCAPILRLIG